MAANEHHHGHVHLDEDDWRSWATHVELEGEVLLAFVTDTATWVDELRGPAAPPLRRIFDIGSGPGVAACELARRYPGAELIAVDASPSMLDRAKQRAAEHGLAGRISTRLAELPDGLEGLGRADLIWASMSLHHVGDEVAALRALRGLLDPLGLIALAERAHPMRVLPADLDVGRPGLAERLDRFDTEWFARMREGLAGAVPSADLARMVASAGFEVVGSRLVTEHLGAPLSGHARRLALGHLVGTRQRFHDELDAADLEALDVLTDADDPRGVAHRTDVFVEATRQIVIARHPSGDV